jgi:hypothetical protein
LLRYRPILNPIFIVSRLWTFCIFLAPIRQTYHAAEALSACDKA